MRVIPDHWQLATLGEIAEPLPVRKQENPAPVLTFKGLQPNGVVELSPEEPGAFAAASGGDIVFTKQGHVGGWILKKVGRIPDDLPAVHVASTLQAVRPRDGVCSKFLAYWLSSVEAYEAVQRLAGERNGLTKAILNAVPVPLPPFDEQRRIVAILEDNLGRLDAAIAGVTHSRSLAETAWRSFLAEELAHARKAGQAMGLGEISTTRLGKMLDAKRNSGTPTPYLRNQNVQWRQIDAVDVLQVPLSSEELLEFAIVEGDLLVCEGGEPGRCAVVTATPDGPLAFQKALHRVRVHDGVNPHFLQLTLEALAVIGDLEAHFTGTTIKHFPQERLRALTIWVPDKVAQDSIVEEASSLRLALDRLLNAMERASRQAEDLRRSVLNAAFSGQLYRESISV